MMKNDNIIAPRIKAPKGYKFKIWKDKDLRREQFEDSDTIRISLLNSITNYEVGNIDLEKMGNRWITHSDLDESLHNRGIGVLMYAKAIQYCHRRGWKVSSSGSSSSDAERLWKSRRLRKLFRIVKRQPKYERTNGSFWFGDPTWYAYPLNKRA